jgi:hypothetical protein
VEGTVAIELTFNGRLDYRIDTKELQDLFHVVFKVLFIEHEDALCDHMS